LIKITAASLHQLEKVKSKLKMFSLFPGKVYFTKNALRIIEREQLDDEMFEILPYFKQCLGALAKNIACPSGVLEQISLRQDLHAYVASDAFNTRCDQPAPLQRDYVMKLLENENVADLVPCHKKVPVEWVISYINQTENPPTTLLQKTILRADLPIDNFLRIFNKLVPTFSPPCYDGVFYSLTDALLTRLAKGELAVNIVKTTNNTRLVNPETARQVTKEVKNN
jgi:hypothetical protein